MGVRVRVGVMSAAKRSARHRGNSGRPIPRVEYPVAFAIGWLLIALACYVAACTLDKFQGVTR